MISGNKQGRLEELFQKKSTGGLILSMALPTIASQLIGVIYNYADSIFVGRLNHPEQVAAIALALPTTLLMTALSNFWGIGGGSMLSRALGRKDYDTARQASAFSFYATLLSSLLLSAIAAAWGDGFIRILGASETVLPFARDYFFWYFTFGTIPAVLSVMLGHLIRAEGFAKPAGNGLMLGGILNVVLDPIFIFPFGLGMGVAGAALATMLSNLASLAFFAVFLWKIRRQTSLSLSWKFALPKWSLCREIMGVGLPSALIMLLSALSNNVLNSLIARHGDRVLAAVGIAKRLDALPAHIAVGLTQGALPLMAYAYAAKQYGKMKGILTTTLKMSFLTILAVIAVMQIFARQMACLFIEDAETVRFATSFIRILCLSVPLYSLSTTINAFYQAINRPKIAFYLSILRKGPLDIPLMFLFEAVFFITNIIWVQPIMDFATVLINLAVLRRFFQKQSPATLSTKSPKEHQHA